VSALPQACSTFNNAIAAPAQIGSSKMAMMSLIHFGTCEEFKIQNSEASRNRAERGVHAASPSNS
jgi:hypothetical protein